MRHSLVAFGVALALLALVVGPLPVAAQAPTPPPPPAITSVSPAVAKPRQSIKVSGRNFIDVRAVTMAGLSLKFKVNSRRKITARAPANATRGTIVVSTRGGVATSPRFVVVKPSLRISPVLSPVGGEVIVRGSGFIPGEPIDLYYGRIPIVAASADRHGVLEETILIVPPQATPGVSMVRAQGRFSGIPVDAVHIVGVAWPQRGLGPGGNRHNRAERAIATTAAASLELDWIADTIGPSRSSPAVVGGMVYVGSDTGALLAVPADCASGGASCDTKALGVTSGAISSSPAVSDFTVYVGSEDGTLYAFDAACKIDDWPCEPRWVAETGGPITSSPVIDGELVVVGSEDGRLYAFETGCASGGSSCSPLWVGETGGAIHSSPAVHDGVAYVGSDDGYLHAFDTDCAVDGGTCQPQWRGWTGGAIRSSPTVANGIVYVGSSDSTVHGFPVGCARDGQTCSAIWRADADAAVESAPVMADGMVVVGTLAGSVMAFSVACSDPVLGCKPTWTAMTGGAVRSSPAVGGPGAGGPVVFVGSDDGFIYGYPLKCRGVGKPPLCQPVWASGTRAAISASPVIVDGVLYASSEDGTVRAWSLP